MRVLGNPVVSDFGHRNGTEVDMKREAVASLIPLVFMLSVASLGASSDEL